MVIEQACPPRSMHISLGMMFFGGAQIALKYRGKRRLTWERLVYDCELTQRICDSGERARELFLPSASR